MIKKRKLGWIACILIFSGLICCGTVQAVAGNNTTTATYLLGDMDTNGEVDANDALEILKRSVGIHHNGKVNGSKELFLCDFDADGILTAVDALDILKISVGLKRGEHAQPLEFTYKSFTADRVFLDIPVLACSKAELDAWLNSQQLQNKGEYFEDYDDAYFSKNALVLVGDALYSEAPVTVKELFASQAGILVVLQDGTQPAGKPVGHVLVMEIAKEQVQGRRVYDIRHKTSTVLNTQPVMTELIFSSKKDSSNFLSPSVYNVSFWDRDMSFLRKYCSFKNQTDQIVFERLFEQQRNMGAANFIVKLRGKQNINLQYIFTGFTPHYSTAIEDEQEVYYQNGTYTANFTVRNLDSSQTKEIYTTRLIIVNYPSSMLDDSIALTGDKIVDVKFTQGF